MSRLSRTLFIAAAILVGLAGLGYAAHTMDLVGMIVRAHVPPRH